MKKQITIAIAAVTLISASSFTVLNDCGSFEQFTEGSTWTTSNYDGNSKLTSHIDCKVTKVTITPEATVSEISANSFDADGKESNTGSYTVTCKGGVYSMDLRSLITPEMKNAARGMDMKLEGDILEYPSSMKAGDSLKGGVMKMIMSSGGMIFSTTTITIKNRKCEKVESRTTPAGTWECYKITSTQELSTKSMMGVTPMAPRTSTEWFSYKVGPVRTESYSNGKLEMYSELTAFKKGGN